MGRLRTAGRRLASMALAATVLGTGCDDDDTLAAEVEPIFTRYVSLGNSITAGYQSSGINDSTQLESFAALVAEQMGLSVGSDFVLPLLNSPGCAPPVVNIFTLERVGGGTSTDCAGRVDASAIIHNVAVPGALVIDALSLTDPRSSPSPLTTLFLGNQSQVEAAAALQPTFVTVWLGNNDALGAALAGDLSLLTPFDVFAEDYAQLAEAVENMGVQGAVLMGVGNVLNIPHLSPGAAYWVGAQQGAFPPTFSVADNCAIAAAGGAGESVLVPFIYGFGTLLAQAATGTPVTLDCLADDPVVGPLEVPAIIGAVARFNSVIEQEANKRGWAYVDVNETLDSLRAAGELPLFPNTSGLDALVRPFGDWFSRDGFHPSSLAHRLIANKVIDAINETYGQQLAAVP